MIDIASTTALFPAGGALFFNAADPPNRWGVWETDGTAAGTVFVQSTLPPTVPYSGFSGFAVSGNNLYFDANDGIHGNELWKTELTGSVSGSVFADTNHNGVRDASEQGMAGVTVFLDANNNGRLDSGEISTTSDASGNYVFRQVPGGVGYAVREVPPAGYRQTAPLAADAKASAIAGRDAAGPVFGNVLVSAVPMDFNYLLTLAQHYGQPGTFATGDLNGDDQVNFSDLLILAQNYGRSLSAVETAPVAASVDALWLAKMHKPQRRAF